MLRLGALLPKLAISSVSQEQILALISYALSFTGSKDLFCQKLSLLTLKLTWRVNKGSYLQTGALLTMTQTPSFSQGLSGQRAGTSGSPGWLVLPVVVDAVVVVVVAVPLGGLVVAVGPGPGLVVLALVVVTRGGGVLG